MRKDQTPFHAIAQSEVIAHFNSSLHGLTQIDAQNRLRQHGVNEMGSDTKVPLLAIFIRQFRNVMVYILLAAAAISMYYGHPIDAAVILGIIALNAVIGFAQEYRAEKAVAALKRLVVQRVKVYRDTAIQELASNLIVPGDVVLLEEGDRVPADGRILSVQSFQTQESSLTGESLPIDKVVRVVPEGTAISDQINMVLSGTVVVRGSATVLITHTGMHTALGAIAKDMQHMNEGATHFQLKSSELTHQMAIIAIVSAVATFIVGYFFQNISLAEILPFTLAALVSAIPESLPLVLMIVLTISAHRMARKNAIVRHLSSAETLGVVNVIITDKTGTLTQNNMSVEKVIFGVDAPVGTTKESLQKAHKKTVEKLIAIASVCHNIRTVRTGGEGSEIIGDPTEKAFFRYAQAIDPSVITYWTKLEDFPFNQHLKVRATLSQHNNSKEHEIFMVGAPESVLHLCSFILVNGKKVKLTNQYKSKIEEEILSLTGDAMRVIGFAYKPVPKSVTGIDEKSFAHLIWAGAVGMIDPARPEALESVTRAQAAGIRVIMATGDHPATALAISRAVGIPSQSYAITAAEMDDLSDQELSEKVKTTSVFARMTPQSKLRLARIFQKQGMIIAMTGDGVNDAPALKGADVGVSMGRVGTDVAREASDIVLADDNFATIVSAIEEGRTQFRNMRRTSFFLITTNVAESVSLLTFLFLGLPIPLLPKQVLWLNLVGGGLTDLALATEPIHEDALKEPPRNAQERILTKNVLPQLLLFTALMTVVALGVYYLFISQGQVKARTGIFIVLSLMQLLNLFNMRSLKKSIFEIGVFTNRQVNYAFGVSFLLLLAVIYIPFVAQIFEFQAFSITELLLLITISFSIIVLGESIKLIQRSRLQD